MFQLKWVWKNLEGCRKRYVFALCSTAVLSMMALVNSVLTAQIMDTVFTPVKEGQGTTPELWHRLVVLVSILIGFTMFRMCFNYLSVMTYETCSQKLLFKLRRDLYANMQAQDSSFFSKNRTGDLMTRLTGDLDMVRHTTCYVIRMIIDCVVLFLTTSITFLCVDWLFALAMLAVTPIIFILTKVFAKQVHPLYVDLRERLSRMNTAAQENIAGNRVVKAFAKTTRSSSLIRKTRITAKRTSKRRCCGSNSRRISMVFRSRFPSPFCSSAARSSSWAAFQSARLHSLTRCAGR